MANDGCRQRLRLDNGPELISYSLAKWARGHMVELCFIQPAQPTQNARYIFNSMSEVRQMLENWRHRYNHQRPHSDLGRLSPAKYTMAHSLSSSSSGMKRGDYRPVIRAYL